MGGRCRGRASPQLGSTASGDAGLPLTGFHGLHVALGVVILVVLLVLTAAGELRDGGAGALSAGALYWHFVDVVWVAIYSVVYLVSAR